MDKAAQIPFFTPIDKWDREKLFQAGEDVKNMLDSPGWQIVKELLEGGYRSIQGQLTYGKTLDQADYAREMGKLVGFEFAQAAAEAVVARAEKRGAEAEAEMAGVS